MYKLDLEKAEDRDHTKPHQLIGHPVKSQPDQATHGL